MVICIVKSIKTQKMSKKKVKCIYILWKGGGIYATQFWKPTLKACLEQVGAKRSSVIDW